MIKIISIILVGLITSLGFFPVEFAIFAGKNSKMIIAGIGLLVIAIHSASRRSSIINRDFFILLIYACLVSLAGLIATAYNNTSDYTYTTYVVSMLVWLSSSYVIISAMRYVHGKVSVEIVMNYLIAVCVAQCILALTMDLYAPLKRFIDSLMMAGSYMGAMENRLHGIGCSLDIAGTRFSAVLIMVAHQCVTAIKRNNNKLFALYLAAFTIITAIGNIISRTTTVGVVLALIFWLYASGVFNLHINEIGKKLWKGFLTAILISLPIIIFCYYNNSTIHSHLRFAFEGFFSLVEKGHWETHSNNMLKNMVIFPDNMKTWIIGDGYFSNPLDSDYHYIGKGIGDYYMYTDIGYLRFLFYFGAIGTVAFCIYMLKAATICMSRFEGYKMMFFFILLVNYIIWCKVATDIFLVFALFLCVMKEENNSVEKERIDLLN